MLAMGIDTATPMVSVSLVRDSELVSRRDQLVHNAHGEVLAGLIVAALDDIGLSPAALDTLGVGLGPGPFTGLRAGIVTAAAMSDALAIPAYGMCSLDAIARDVVTDGEPFAVVTDARRRQVYWAVYSETGVCLEGPDISTPADLADHLRGGVDTITGSTAVDHADAFAGFRLGGPTWPDTARIAMDALGRAGRGEQSHPLSPMYLRRPDARPPHAPKKVTPR